MSRSTRRCHTAHHARCQPGWSRAVTRCRSDCGNVGVQGSRILTLHLRLVLFFLVLQAVAGASALLWLFWRFRVPCATDTFLANCIRRLCLRTRFRAQPRRHHWCRPRPRWLIVEACSLSWWCDFARHHGSGPDIMIMHPLRCFPCFRQHRGATGGRQYRVRAVSVLMCALLRDRLPLKGRAEAFGSATCPRQSDCPSERRPLHVWHFGVPRATNTCSASCMLLDAS